MIDEPISFADTGRRKFFISRAGVDSRLATDMRDILRRNGAEAVTQEDFPPGSSFIDGMHRHLASDWRVIAVMSCAYMASENCFAEWQQPLAGDPRNLSSRLIILKIDDVKPSGLFSALTYWNLQASLAEKHLLESHVLQAVGLPEIGGRGERFKPQRFDSEYVRTNVPFSSLAEMVGRDIDLERLGAAITLKGRTPLACLTGLGGVGKTTLARQFARRMAPGYAVVWWVNAETEIEIVRDLAALKRAEVGVSPGEDDRTSALAALQLCAKHEGKPWLLVFDNVSKPAAIDAWIPVGNCNIVITTRWTSWPALEPGQLVAVETLPRSAAVELLLTRSAQPDDGCAAALAEALGDLPLALDHAAAYLAEIHDGSFAWYLDNLASLTEKLPDSAEYPRSVAQTFELAIQRIESRLPEVGLLLAFASFWPPERIDFALLTQPSEIYPEGIRSLADDSTRLREAIGLLRRYSLIRLSDDGRSFAVHRLVQAFARRRAGARITDIARSAVLSCHLAYDHGGFGADIKASDGFAARLSYAVASANEVGMDFGHIPPNAFNNCEAALGGDPRIAAPDFYVCSMRRALECLPPESRCMEPILRHAAWALARASRHGEAADIWLGHFVPRWVGPPCDAMDAFDRLEYGECLVDLGELERAEEPLRAAIEYGLLLHATQGHWLSVEYRGLGWPFHLVVLAGGALKKAGKIAQYATRITRMVCSEVREGRWGLNESMLKAYLPLINIETADDHLSALESELRVRIRSDLNAAPERLDAVGSSDSRIVREALAVIDTIRQFGLAAVAKRLVNDLEHQFISFIPTVSFYELDRLLEQMVALCSPGDAIRALNCLLGTLKFELEPQAAERLLLSTRPIICSADATQLTTLIRCIGDGVPVVDREIWRSRVHQHTVTALCNTGRWGEASSIARAWLLESRALEDGDAALVETNGGKVGQFSTALPLYMLRQGLHEEATNLALCLIRAGDRTAGVLGICGRALFDLGDELAVEALEMATRESHTAGSLLPYLAGAYWRGGQFGAARQLLDREITLSSDDRMQIALFGARAEAPEEALNSLLAMVDEEGYDITLLYQELCWAAFRAGRPAAMHEAAKRLQSSGEDGFYSELCYFLSDWAGASGSREGRLGPTSFITELSEKVQSACDEGARLADMAFVLAVLRDDEHDAREAVAMATDRSWDDQLRWSEHSAKVLHYRIPRPWLDGLIKVLEDSLVRVGEEMVEARRRRWDSLIKQPIEPIFKSNDELMRSMPKKGVVITCRLPRLEGFDREIDFLKSLLTSEAGGRRTVVAASLMNTGHGLFVCNFKWDNEDVADLKILVDVEDAIKAGFIEQQLLSRHRVQSLVMCDPIIAKQLSSLRGLTGVERKTIEAPMPYAE